jgi:hypothetical protein
MPLHCIFLHLCCSVLTHITLKWASSSSSNWVALQPHILAGAHKALAALSLLSSRSLAEGFLVGACKLVTAATQVLTSIIDASSSSNNSIGGTGTQDQQQQQRGSAVGKAGSSSQHQKGSKKKQAGQAKAAAAAAALEDKPFAKRHQQQQQQKVQSGTASQGTAGAGVGVGAGTVAAVDDMLAVLESVMQYVLPAAARVLPAAAEKAAAAQQGLPAGQQQQQHQLGVFCGLLQAVQQLLLALLSSGKKHDISPECELTFEHMNVS